MVSSQVLFRIFVATNLALAPKLRLWKVYQTPRWVAGVGDHQGKGFPTIEHPPRKNRREGVPGDAQGCCMMGFNERSHDWDTPGPPDQPGNYPIKDS